MASQFKGNKVRVIVCDLPRGSKPSVLSLRVSSSFFSFSFIFVLGLPFNHSTSLGGFLVLFFF